MIPKTQNLIIVITFLLTLTGCANSPVNKEDTKSYKDVEGFLNDRLINKKSYNKGEGIGYVAYFTEVNDRYLKKPIHDAKGYCELNEGTWSRVSTTSNKNLYKNYNKFIVDAFAAKAMVYKAEMYNSSDYEKYKAYAFEKAMSKAARFYNSSNYKNLLWVIERAAKNGFLGTFSCGVKNESKWFISVTPRNLRPGVSGTLNSHSAVLDIEFLKH